METKTCLVVCGAGFATSTVGAKACEQVCKELGFKAKVEKRMATAAKMNTMLSSTPRKNRLPKVLKKSSRFSSRLSTDRPKPPFSSISWIASISYSRSERVSLSAICSALSAGRSKL